MHDDFFVSMRLDIPPKGQGRARATIRGKHASMYKDKADVEFETTLAAMLAPHRPRGKDGNPIVLEGPIEVVILAVSQRPASMCKVSKRTGLPLQDPSRYYNTGKPDNDNIEKAVFDAMKHWWNDDAQIVLNRTMKLVAAFREAPHYQVLVRRPIEIRYADFEWLADIPF